MHKFVASLLIFTLLVVLMTLPAKTTAIAPVIVAPPVDPTTVVINIVVNVVAGILAILGLGGPDCDKLTSDFFKIPGAQSMVGGNKPFGGKIAKKTKCVCKKSNDISEVIMIGSPKEAIIGVTPKSKVFDYRSINVGNWVLGKTTNRKVCDYPPAYEVDIIGTSK